MPTYDDSELIQRAHIAFRKAGGNMQPAPRNSEIVDVEGRIYAVLRNSHQILAVYQYNYKSDSLKALTTWPDEIQ